MGPAVSARQTPNFSSGRALRSARKDPLWQAARVPPDVAPSQVWTLEIGIMNVFIIVFGS